MTTPSHTRTKFLTLLAAALLAAVLPAPAQAPAAKSPPLADAEKRFVKEAADSLLVGQLLATMGARSLTASDGTKTLTTKVNGELEKAWTEFATVSMAKNAQIPTEVNHTDKAAAGKIGKLTADKMEKELIKELAKESKKNARAFETAAKSLRDPELKAFAEKWAPTLKGHSTELDQYEDKLKKTK